MPTTYRIDFCILSTPQCATCRVMEARVREVVKRLVTRSYVTVYKLTEKSDRAALDALKVPYQGVTSVPQTYVLCNGTQIMDLIPGLMSVDEIVARVVARMEEAVRV